MYSAFRVLMILSLVSAATTTQPTTKPVVRQSMDKVRYPDAIPLHRPADQLPLVGRAMGEVPEKALGGQWVSISGDTERAKRLRDRLATLKIGTDGTQFCSNGGPGGATDTLIGLTDGRITRMVLVFGTKMTWADAERKLRDYSVQSVRAESGGQMQGTYGALDRNDVKYYARVIGYWQMSTDATVQKHYNSNSTVTSTAVAGQRVDGPTGIVVDVDAFSWGLANYVDPKNLDTVRKHTLVTGLTTTEARVAMCGKYSKTVQENGKTEIEFYTPAPGDNGSNSPAGPANRGHGANNAAPGAGGHRHGNNNGGGGGGGSIAAAGAGQGNAQPQDANSATGAAGATDHGGYAGEVKIQGAQYASTYTFSEDVGNVDSRAVLVATAVVKDGVVTQVVN